MGIERKDMRSTGNHEVNRSIARKGEKNASVNFLTGFMQCAVYEFDNGKSEVQSIF